MIVVRTVAELRAAVASARRRTRPVSLVPTMGAFHAGHRSLMRRAHADGGFTVVSLFVNPAQFNDPADLEQGPLSERGADTQPTPERVAASVQISDRVQEALGLLTALERAAFTLRHVEGMSIEEVGEKLGMKTSATKHSIFRAVRKMRTALEPFVES